MQELLELRYLVALLGESATPAWWGSRLLTSDSRALLRRLIPRAESVSALWTVSAAAARVHDERIGVGAVAHIFRLPAALEERLYEAARSGSDGTLAITTVPSATKRLAELARGLEVPAAQGPVHVGGLTTLTSSRGLGRLAAHYLDGFARSTPVFPYVAA